MSEGVSEGLMAQALDLAGGDIEAAQDHYYRLFIANRAALDEKLPDIVKGWCRQQVLAHYCKARRETFYRAPEQQGARLRAARAMYLDFPLPVTGKPLREASADDLAGAIGFYRERATDADAKARWLAAIAGRIGNRLVGEALSEADLAALREAIDV